jgi:hypothetical protein
VVEEDVTAVTVSTPTDSQASQASYTTSVDFSSQAEIKPY